MRYLPTKYDKVYLVGCGHFLPGEPVDNQDMDHYIAPINSQSKRIKARILRENGITHRYYAINPDGTTRYSATRMAAHATTDCLRHARRTLSDITLLATGSGGGDVLMPGLANMLQGDLKAPPMETCSHHGICASGVQALKNAANQIQAGTHAQALVTAVEFPSRLFKKSRFAPQDYHLDFDAHFLRWMLSDGAGACLLSSQFNTDDRLALKLDWLHTKSFSGDYPVCMQLGQTDGVDACYLDFPSFADAEAQGYMNVRQNIRMLPQLFEIGIHEYAELVKQHYLDPDKVDHFLCHYSSEALGDETEQLMHQAGLRIPREKWFSNLKTCGNTGSASIFIMLSAFMRQTELTPGEQVFCFVPESGRFTVSYFMFTVVDTQTDRQPELSIPVQHIAPPHSPDSTDDKRVQHTLQALAGIWHEYRSNVWRTQLINKILNGKLSLDEYRDWMACWIPQVREGSKWMRTAIANLPAELQELQTLIDTHAGEEQDDYLILYDDYLAAGGTETDIDSLRRNPGGEALNAYMYSVANSDNPIGLLGGIYIIEGTGQRIVPVLLPELRNQLPLTERGFRFLRYHSENDINHLARWLKALTIALHRVPQDQQQANAAQILKTAQTVAQLYFMQWEHVL